MNGLLNKLQEMYGYTNYEIAVIKYAVTAILSELSKLIILSIFYLYIGKLNLFIISFILLIFLRINCGGYHCKHYISCLLLTFAVSYASIILLPAFFRPNYSIILAALAICLFTNYYIGPVASPFRPAPDSLLIKHCRNNGFIPIFIFLIIVSIFNTNSMIQPYLIIGFWTIILHTIQLIIAKILRKGDVS